MSKNERCSLAARILYSNFQKTASKPSINSNIDRLKRPATLAKPILSTSPSSGGVIEQKSKLNQTKTLLNSNNNSNYKIIGKQLNQTLTDIEDQFPPPPLAQQIPQAINGIYLQNNHITPPTILQEYQDPALLNIRPTSDNITNIQSQLSNKIQKIILNLYTKIL